LERGKGGRRGGKLIKVKEEWDKKKKD